MHVYTCTCSDDLPYEVLGVKVAKSLTSLLTRMQLQQKEEKEDVFDGTGGTYVKTIVHQDLLNPLVRGLGMALSSCERFGHGPVLL